MNHTHANTTAAAIAANAVISRTEYQMPSASRRNKNNQTPPAIDNINRPRYRLLRLRNRFFLSRKKRKLLKSFSWYRTVTGKWVHPHMIDSMSWWEIRKLNINQLEYKLRHGSQAELPKHLEDKKGD